MKKMVNGEMVEGSPSEILEYEKLLQGSETIVSRAAGGETFRAGHMKVVHRIGQGAQQYTQGEFPEIVKAHRYRTVTVSERQFLVLDEMRKADKNLSRNDIAQKIGLGPQEVSSALDRLGKKKLVSRVNGHWLWALTDRGANCPIKIANSRATL